LAEQPTNTKAQPSLFADNHLLAAPKPTTECYVIERFFFGTVAQRSDYMHEGPVR